MSSVMNLKLIIMIAIMKMKILNMTMNVMLSNNDCDDHVVPNNDDEE